MNPRRRQVPRGPATGRWYFVVTILTAGLFAWLPFLHAAQRLGRPQLRQRAAIFGGVAVVMGLISSLAPSDAAGNPVGVAGNVLQSLSAMIALATIVVACLQLAPLRAEVYRTALPMGQPVGGGFADPAIAAVLAARARRAEARAIVAKDPLMARELGIGRPGTQRRYDDGGLVDLNSATAATIASTCGVSISVAELLVESRTARGGVFTDATEALIVSEVPVQFWDQIKDRAVLVP